MMKAEILEEIGLSKNESKVYLALVDLGSSSAGEISKKCKLHRTNVYDSLRRLCEKGFAAFIEKDKTKYFNATDPEALMALIKEKEMKLQGIMPQLQLAHSMSEQGHAQVIEGVKAVTRALENLLKYKETIYVFGLNKNVPDFIKHWTPRFHGMRVPKKIDMVHIYNQDAKDRILALNKMSHTEARSLPPEYDSPVATNICGPEVIMILWEKPVFAVRIVSEQIADAYRRYFKLLWKQAK